MAEWIIPKTGPGKAIASIQAHTSALGKNTLFHDYSNVLAQQCLMVGYQMGVGTMLFSREFSDTLLDVHNSDIFSESRDITLKQARKEIAEYFRIHDGEDIDYVDLMDALNIHLPLIVEACAKLEKEGKIAAVDQG